MTNVNIKSLPHAVPTDSFAKPEVRKLAMLLMENIKSLKRQLEEAQTAIQELQRRK